MRLGLVVRGVVQGVGFRPFVYRAATERGLTGWVQNARGEVRVEIQGAPAAVESFAAALSQVPPPAAIEALERRELSEAAAEGHFRIVASEEAAAPGAVLPADLATCDACWREVSDQSGRRVGYPFTSCARCGPRYSIVTDLPYDRRHTTMAVFTMCDRCGREYADVSDRRHHAQPIACPDCGPRLHWVQDAQVVVGDAEAIARAGVLLRAGGILALRGVGGFQLLGDARSDAAIAELRVRKQRPHKPFAVMFRDADELAQHAELDGAEQALLESPEAPIVLLRRRLSSDLSEAVAPENPILGAMLPYTPLHRLVLEALGGPAVCTSGNLSSEPMCLTLEQARAELGSIADAFLSHEREIARPLDDSVVRLAQGRLQILRRARGYVPRPVARAPSSRSVLALGAHLKSTVALSVGGEIVVSQHLGDLEGPAARALLERTALDLCRFFSATVEMVACDLHPDYASTALAESLAARWQVPLSRVQHHHAHIAACMAEAKLSGPALGLAWDGTGLGDDGTSWGGEALRCDVAGYRRLAHLASFPLPGGDRAARDPRRAAFGVLSAFAPRAAERLGRRWFGDGLSLLWASLESGLAPRCSSVGRLFDAVAALIGLEAPQTFEGQAAMALEVLAGQSDDDGRYPFELSDGVLDPRALLSALLSDLEAGVEPRHLARRFHAALVDGGVAVAEQAATEDVVLTGGCFQNQLLLEQLMVRLGERGFRVHTPRNAPPNDGGIAVGQAWIACQTVGSGASAYG